MKRKNLVWNLLIIFLMLPFLFSCEKEYDEVQPEQIITAPSETDVSGTSVDALQVYINQLTEQGFSEVEITRKLQEYINTKAVNYTYTISGINIGSWMLLSKDTEDRAHWLDSWIYEPITNMWKDKVSSTSSDALKRVSDHLEEVGYGLSSCHSYAYYGYIDETYKYNANDKKTWSDDYWFVDNNHGRIFGPVKVGNYWVTLGAFSRETGIWHKFINFYEARNKAANYSSYFPTLESKYSGNTWEDGYSYVKVRIKN